MKRIFFASLVIGLITVSPLFAQTSGDAPAPQNGSPAPTPAPPAEAEAIPPPKLLPLQPRPIEPAPPGPPPLAPTAAPPPPMFADAALDAFATRYWVGVDYLLWWTKGDRLPVLISTGSPNDAVPGALGQPGTLPLFGGDYDSRLRSGVRVRGGYWFTPDRQTLGMDATFFFLGGQAHNFDDGSNGIPVLTRPFYNVNTGQEDAFIVAYPGRQGGEIAAALSTRLWGADVNLRGMLCRGAFYQVNLLGGFRFLALHDSLGVKEDDTFFPQTDGDPTTWTTTVDRFHTSNQFYGGQIGTDVMWSRGRFFIDVLGKVALGVSVEHAGIDGASTFNNSLGQYGTIGAGQLALPSNVGGFGQSRFAVVPEAGINFGYAVTRHIRLTIGYTLIYWSNVFRAGDQVDRGLNPTQLIALAGQGPLIGPARPNFTFQSTDFWAQGLNFGLQFRY